MTTPVPVRLTVPPPPVEAPRYTLLTTAPIVPSPDGPLWQLGGVEFETDMCATGGYVPASCPTALTTGGPGGDPGADPVTVEAEVCVATHADDKDLDITVQPGAGTAVEFTIHSPLSATPLTGVINPGQTQVITLTGGIAHLHVTFMPFPANASAVPCEIDIDLPCPDAQCCIVRRTDPPGPVPDPFATTHDKTFGPNTWVTGPPPFTIYAPYKCQLPGAEPPSTWPGRALTRLAAIETRLVELAFFAEVLRPAGNRQPPLAPWTGALNGYGLRRALGALEQDARQQYAGTVYIHAPVQAIDWAVGYGLVVPDTAANILRTPLGNRWVFGAGYANTGPLDMVPDPPGTDFWLYATGAIAIRRSEPFVNTGLRVTSNDFVALAERTYALAVDCYRAAVPVDVDADCCPVGP